MSLMVDVLKTTGPYSVSYWMPLINQIIKEYHQHHFQECVRQAKLVLYLDHPIDALPNAIVLWLVLIVGHLSPCWIEADYNFRHARTLKDGFYALPPVDLRQFSKSYQVCLAATNGDLFWEQSLYCIEDLQEQLADCQPPAQRRQSGKAMVGDVLRNDSSQYREYNEYLQRHHEEEKALLATIRGRNARGRKVDGIARRQARRKWTSADPLPANDNQAIRLVHPVVPRAASAGPSTGPHGSSGAVQAVQTVQLVQIVTADTPIPSTKDRDGHRSTNSSDAEARVLTSSPRISHISPTGAGNQSQLAVERMNAAVSYGTHVDIPATNTPATMPPPGPVVHLVHTHPIPPSTWGLALGYRRPWANGSPSPAFRLWFNATIFGHPMSLDRVLRR